MKKYVIDTDPGYDDAMAIMLAIKADLDIIAITTVAGNSTIENTTRNTRYTLGLLNSKIPVYSGASKPLERELIKAVVHGESGLGGIDPSIPTDLTNNAVEKILSIVNEYKSITLIALGPLTNIAKAIQNDANIMKNVEEIIIMGGAIRVPGNKNRVAEFNMFVDPEAADIVLKFPVKKILVPLDACNHVKLYLEDFKKIKGALREPLLSMATPYIANIAKDEGVEAALMYDPLTIYYLINPRACTVKLYDVLVETAGILTRGMTVADLRPKPESVNPVKVVEHVSTEEFKKDFVNILTGD